MFELLRGTAHVCYGLDKIGAFSLADGTSQETLQLSSRPYVLSVRTKKKDIQELSEFVKQAKRPRVKEALENVIQKLVAESGGDQALEDVRTSGESDTVDDVDESNVIDPKPAISPPEQPKSPLPVSSRKVWRQKPKFRAKINLRSGHTVDVIIDENHREGVMKQSSVVCNALAKYVKEKGVPSEPIYLDLDSLLTQPKSILRKKVTPKVKQGKTNKSTTGTVWKFKEGFTMPWNDEQKGALLNCYLKYRDQMPKAANQESVWNMISKDFSKLHGKELGGTECRAKFTLMKRQYSNARKNKSSTFKWFKEFSDLFDSECAHQAVKGKHEGSVGAVSATLCTWNRVNLIEQELDSGEKLSSAKVKRGPKHHVGSEEMDTDASDSSLFTDSDSETDQSAPKKQKIQNHLISVSARKSEQERFETLKHVKMLMEQSDQRLNETLLKLHENNKVVMEKLIEKF